MAVDAGEQTADILDYLETDSNRIDRTEGEPSDDETGNRLSGSELAEADTRPIGEQQDERKQPRGEDGRFNPYQNEAETPTGDQAAPTEPVYVSDLDQIDPALRADIEEFRKWKPFIDDVRAEDPRITDGETLRTLAMQREENRTAQGEIKRLADGHTNAIWNQLTERLDRGEIGEDYRSVVYGYESRLAPYLARDEYERQAGERYQQNARLQNEAQSVKTRYDLTDDEALIVQMAASNGQIADEIGKRLKNQRLALTARAATNAVADRAEGKKPAAAPVPRNPAPRQATVKASDVSWGDLIFGNKAKL